MRSIQSNTPQQPSLVCILRASAELIRQISAPHPCSVDSLTALRAHICPEASYHTINHFMFRPSVRQKRLPSTYGYRC